MGCAASKLDMESESKLPPALRPIRRKIEEVKKRRNRRRSRRYSIVSTTELLEPEESDTTGETGSSSGKVKASAVAPEPIKEEETEETNKEELKNREEPNEKKEEPKEKNVEPKEIKREEPKEKNDEPQEIKNEESKVRDQKSEEPKEKNVEPEEIKSEESKVRDQKSEEPKEKSEEEMKKEKEKEEEEKQGAKLTVKIRSVGTDQEEYLAGSPSFRFYCLEAAPRNNQSFDSDESVKLAGFRRSVVDQKLDGIKVLKAEPIEEGAESQASSESSACSSVAKREKGRKLFRNLTKGKSAVKGLFTCYSHNSHNSPSAAANHHEKPHLLCEKNH